MVKSEHKQWHLDNCPDRKNRIHSIALFAKAFIAEAILVTRQKNLGQRLGSLVEAKIDQAFPPSDPPRTRARTERKHKTLFFFVSLFDVMRKRPLRFTTALYGMHEWDR